MIVHTKIIKIVIVVYLKYLTFQAILAWYFIIIVVVVVVFVTVVSLYVVLLLLKYRSEYIVVHGFFHERFFIIIQIRWNSRSDLFHVPVKWWA